MTHLDGNALAGPLADLLGGDVTSMLAECASCGSATVIAALIVALDDRGAIARCPHCTAVMLDLRDLSLDVRGIRMLRAAR
jgi:hypothetical protein